MKRILTVVMVSTVLALVAVGGAFAQQIPPAPGTADAAKPEFKAGFKNIATLAPDMVGEPLENEQPHVNGDTQQRTTKGLMVWRKLDNVPAFTNGQQTLVLGPNGLEMRGNDSRFQWEVEAEKRGQEMEAERQRQEAEARGREAEAERQRQEAEARGREAEMEAERQHAAEVEAERQRVEAERQHAAEVEQEGQRQETERVRLEQERQRQESGSRSGGETSSGGGGADDSGKGR